MAQVHFDTQSIQESYGSNSLKLTILISHIKSFLRTLKYSTGSLGTKMNTLMN